MPATNLGPPSLLERPDVEGHLLWTADPSQPRWARRISRLTPRAARWAGPKPEARAASRPAST